jgi:hypothetical protein
MAFVYRPVYTKHLPDGRTKAGKAAKASAPTA